MGPQGRRSKQIMKEIFQRQTPPLPADLPAGVGELLQRCFSTSAAQRIPSTELAALCRQELLKLLLLQ
jgi:hypothetical protein